VGSTGTGKGVILQNLVYQSILSKKGIIIVDPKNDSFLPQVIKETLREENRPSEDLKICYYPNKWGYKAITDDDSYLEISNKLIDMFDYTESSNPGVDYYRSLGRTILRKLMKIFFMSLELKKYIKKDFLDIKKHIILLKEDLQRQKDYDYEIGKTRPNAELLEKYSKRYFNPEILKKMYFANTDTESLDSLSIKFEEVTEGISFNSDIDIRDALYKGKIIYFRVDMNDVASLKWIKFLITDIIQKSKKKISNANIYLDELSFYGSKTLAGALATTRSMGLEFSMFLQAISQLNDEIREDTIENCNFKMFYKTSNITTLDYIEKLGGIEAITKVSTKNGDISYSQDFESFLNVTKIRSLPRTSVAIAICEYLPFPEIIQTNYIETSKIFDWGIFQENNFNFKADENIKISKKDDVRKLEKYRVYLKENKNLLENSDLFGVVLGSKLI